MAPSTYYDTKARGPSQRACRDAVLGPALVGGLGRTTTGSMGCASCGKPHVGPVTTWAVTRWPG